MSRKGKKRETILGSPKNRASPPETHGSKFLNSLFRASLRWDQQSWPAQILHLSRQDDGVALPTRAIQKAHRPTAFFESRSNPIGSRIRLPFQADIDQGQAVLSQAAADRLEKCRAFHVGGNILTGKSIDNQDIIVSPRSLHERQSITYMTWDIPRQAKIPLCQRE